MSKLNATQDVIRNKFKQIHANRLEHEHNVEQTLKPLTADSTPTSPPPPQTDAIEKMSQLRSRNISKVNHHDPNALCDELRTQLYSPLADSKNSKHLINAILEELRVLDIIV